MRNSRLALRTVVALAALGIIGVATVEAKQACNVAAGAQGYWSWRVIDGRKCWYQGKPMLSKAQLEWPAAQASAKPVAEADAASAPALRRNDPMDAQAAMRSDAPTFEALWRARIENK